MIRMSIPVDVIYPLPQGWGMCLTCEMFMARAELDEGPYQRGLEEYPLEWQAEFQRLSDIILELSERYQSSIIIRIWDPRSLQGLWKSIRYGVRRYPTFIVGESKKVAGWEVAQVEAALKTFLTGAGAI